METRSSVTAQSFSPSAGVCSYISAVSENRQKSVFHLSVRCSHWEKRAERERERRGRHLSATELKKWGIRKREVFCDYNLWWISNFDSRNLSAIHYLASRLQEHLHRLVTPQLHRSSAVWWLKPGDLSPSTLFRNCNRICQVAPSWSARWGWCCPTPSLTSPRSHHLVHPATTERKSRISLSIQHDFLLSLLVLDSV